LVTLERFSAPTRAWFEAAFAAPTPAQVGAWESIPTGENVLVIAPTGSGKTLAAFLWAIDRLSQEPPVTKDANLRVLYVSPLKALAVDVERNLRSPLVGIGHAARRLGLEVPEIDVAVRTGDTPQNERARIARRPPGILITTPESLFLMLTSRAREAMRNIRTVIVDEVHAVAATKRGSHLALSLERLDELLKQPAQRVGLSATVRPQEEVARLLGGVHPVKVVDARTPKAFELSVEVPVEDMTAPGDGLDEADPEAQTSIWPSVVPRLVELIRQHRSTILFCNSRRLAERLCSRINEHAGELIARAHHGSVAREQRIVIEEALKSGELPCVVATSSLELGIDMGAVDLVVQVEAPPSVASGLQRIGRGGHHVGATSRGVVFPKFRGDLLQCAVVVDRMREQAIESIRYPRNPLDVLAQQIVAMVAMDDWTVDELAAVCKRAAPFHELPQSGFESVLDMLAGRYPSDAFAELRPRILWDRVTGRLTARPGAQKLAVTSGGTIPDRGLYGVFLASGDDKTRSRVGELDEEMVYESRPGETFVLGASTWRIEEITHDRVLVSPAPGEPGKMPFWHGDAPGRPVELGRAVGAFVRRIASMDGAEAAAELESQGLDERAARNLVVYLAEQKEATGHLPDDRTIVLERFRDELGDWRVCVHTPFGAPIHAPWAQAIEARVRDRLQVEVQTMYTDDGIVVRLPEADEAPAAGDVFFEPEEIEEIVVSNTGGSALFASRFRECAARSLLLPRRRPGGRTPLWQQRQRSADLLSVASRHPQFPVVLETMRECLQDVFDVPALKELMASVTRKRIRIVEVETRTPSPFATSLQFGYIASFMYEGDAPLAERRAQALSLDRKLLAELLGAEELRELIAPDVLESVEMELQRLIPERRARDAEDLADMLRSLGDLSADEAAARSVHPEATPRWLADLEEARRALRLRIGSQERFVAAEDAGRFRDAVGAALPVGIPHAFLEPVDDPLGDLVSRYARTHGPFTASDLASRLGLGEAVATAALRQLEGSGRVVHGAFSPAGNAPEWCDIEVLRRLRRRSLASLRAEVEAVPPSALVRFLPAWHGVGVGRPGTRDATMDSLCRAVEQLAGAWIPASQLESLVLPARVPGYHWALLEELCALGEVVWAGRSALGAADAWITLVPAHEAPLLLATPVEEALTDDALRVREALERRGAMFFRRIAEEIDASDDRVVLDAIWQLVWSGFVTNDTLAPLRALVAGEGSKARKAPAPRSRSTGWSRRWRSTGSWTSRSPSGRPQIPTRLGPPTGAGRWSLLPERSGSATERLHAAATRMLDRHGVLVRGAVVAEGTPGGYAGAYQVLKAMEDAGRARRGYFVEGLGGAQFALAGAVERLRTLASDADEPPARVLPAADPANPFGAALPWPETIGHRPARKAGALVVTAGGSLALYVEKGGRSLLTFTSDEDVLQAAVDALALAVREGMLGTLAVERADGGPLEASPLNRALRSAGFTVTPRGLRLRA
jgi:ATP-dependent Lhr-like helicase